MPRAQARLLSGHHVQHAVLSLIEDVAERLILVSAYVQTWEPLRIVLRKAIQRGVRIDLAMRSPDGERGVAARLQEEVATLEKMGLRVHFVHRLHAKMYVSEKAAVVTSFNFVDASQSSVEVGVLLTDPDLVRQCMTVAQDACEGLCDPDSAQRCSRRTTRVSEAPRNVDDDQGYCIGCGQSLSFDPDYPLCLQCYRDSDAGEFCEELPNRMCHDCGRSYLATLDRPLCKSCYRSGMGAGS